MAKQKADKKKKKGSLIKEVNINKGVIKESLSTYENIDYTLFSFKYLHEDSIENCSKSKFFFDLLLRLKKFSVLGWDEIRKSHRHSFGMEKIPISSIIPQRQYPPFITPDVTDFSVFRSNGNNTGIVGFQIEKIFHVFYIETKHGDIYNH